MTVQLDAIHTILADVDLILRARLADVGAEDFAYIVMTIMSDGSALVRGNVDPHGLKALAKDLDEAAELKLQRQPSSNSLN